MVDQFHWLLIGIIAAQQLSIQLLVNKAMAGDFTTYMRAKDKPKEKVVQPDPPVESLARIF